MSSGKMGGNIPVTLWLTFHPDGRVTGRHYNSCRPAWHDDSHGGQLPVVAAAAAASASRGGGGGHFAIDGTFAPATGAYTERGTYGNMSWNGAGTITEHRFESRWSYIYIIRPNSGDEGDSGTLSLTFVDSNDPFERVSTSAAAGCYMGCFTGGDCGCRQPMCPVLASVSAKDENTLQECCWVFPLPVACPQTWVRNGDTNWFVEQGNLVKSLTCRAWYSGLVKDLVSARYHNENKGYFTCCKLL